MFFAFSGAGAAVFLTCSTQHDRCCPVCWALGKPLEVLCTLNGTTNPVLVDGVFYMKPILYMECHGNVFFYVFGILAGSWDRLAALCALLWLMVICCMACRGTVFFHVFDVLVGEPGTLFYRFRQPFCCSRLQRFRGS